MTSWILPMRSLFILCILGDGYASDSANNTASFWAQQGTSTGFLIRKQQKPNVIDETET